MSGIQHQRPAIEMTGVHYASADLPRNPGQGFQLVHSISRLHGFQMIQIGLAALRDDLMQARLEPLRRHLRESCGLQLGG